MSKLKMLGLAALAVLAVSSVSASAASAAEGTFVVSAGTTGVTGTQTGSGNTITLVGGRVFSCTTSTFAGSMTNGDKTFTSTHTETGCTVKVGASTLPSTVNGTGCVYRQYDYTTTAADTYATLTDLICPPGATGIHITVYANHANHTAGIPLCVYTIPPFTAATGRHFTRNTNGTLTGTNTNVAVPVNRTSGTAGNCGEASFNASLNGSSLITASTGTLEMDD